MTQWIVGGLTLLAMAGGFLVGWRIAGPRR